jgi:hypothetical protein
VLFPDDVVSIGPRAVPMETASSANNVTIEKSLSFQTGHLSLKPIFFPSSANYSKIILWPIFPI